MLTWTNVAMASSTLSLQTFPNKKACLWQVNHTELTASLAVLSPTEAGGHEEGAWGSALQLEASLCRDPAGKRGRTGRQ